MGLPVRGFQGINNLFRLKQSQSAKAKPFLSTQRPFRCVVCSQSTTLREPVLSQEVCSPWCTVILYRSIGRQMRQFLLLLMRTNSKGKGGQPWSTT